MDDTQKNNIKDAISKVELKQCKMCGDLISKKEYDQAEGVCFKHWDN